MKIKIYCLMLFLFAIIPSFHAHAQEATKGAILFEKGVPMTQNGQPFIARNPFNPALPFPANAIYKNSTSDQFGTVIVQGKEYWGQLEFDLDPMYDDSVEGDDLFQNASEDLPKLYGSRNYLVDDQDIHSAYKTNWESLSGVSEAGIIYSPTAWNFVPGMIQDGDIILSAQGEKALYTDEYSHLQVWDNRSPQQEAGWSIKAKMKDWPTAPDGSQLVGSYLVIPTGVARNELNDNPAQEDQKFLTMERKIDAQTAGTLWQTKGEKQLQEDGFSQEEILTTGRAMSTLTWKTSDIQLVIPPSSKPKESDYSIRIIWYLEQAPEI